MVSTVAAFLAYIAAITLANVATERFGLVPVGFGFVATAGTYFAGFALLARDFVQSLGGIRWVIAGIGIGAVLSWLLASPAIAVASVLAFAVAELVDLIVFTVVRRRGFVRAAALSNVVSAPLDSLVFLAVAGFPITWSIMAGQIIGKLLWATALPLLVFVAVRYAISRHTVNAKDT